uniref:AAA+ ATPase domain-containing protein n=1 Tax=viral metagenome TaxID=1070528 RepID=A0A6C0LPD7_9ZZZZ
MQNININNIFDRDKIANEIKSLLSSFDENCKNIKFKKGIYVYGSPGSGKTEFVMKLLKDLNYDVIKYDAGDVRNKSLIDTITSNNISNRNVLQMMTKQVKKIAIVMDEIDGMNNGDKGGITALIKLIRQKKTKKQRLENMTMNPIICIGNYYMDKKMRELMKVCNTFELQTPTKTQINKLITTIMPNIQTNKSKLKENMVNYIQGDLRKLMFIHDIYHKKPDILNNELFENILQTKSYNEDSKKITQTLLETPMKMEEHNKFMNETDRTIVALLWHENIVDVLNDTIPEKSYPFYLKILDNICYADYIDRITFQNQIWQFNEMSSLMKTFYNNKLYHDNFPKTKQITDIRFTKVLTKYSTEYNNILFIYNLSQELDMDKKDLMAFFQELRLHYGENFCNQVDKMTDLLKLFENYNISKLDIKRIYRYLDKNVKKDILTIIDEDLDEDLEDD